ncbi:hypothetical protein CK203_015088 [Vitis vinifera]|uniref:Uncharacterized protein n=1 Tax=Vitis vinifera TaxID=29760 RepID=A0A438JD22_VITVI|nr:hypothetical protein CK203_015088 [Vitis vinifera]
MKKGIDKGGAASRWAIQVGGEGKAVTPLKLVCSGNIPITIRHVAKTTCKGAPPHRTQTTPVRISNLCFVKRKAWTNQNPFPSTTSSWHVGARKLANHSTPPATLCDRRRSPASHLEFHTRDLKLAARIKGGSRSESERKMYVVPPPQGTDPGSGSTSGSDALRTYQTWKGSNVSPAPLLSFQVFSIFYVQKENFGP